MKLTIVLALPLLSLVACGGGSATDPTPQIGVSTTAKIEAAGGGGGGGGGGAGGGGGGGGAAPTAPPQMPPTTPTTPSPAPGGGPKIPPSPSIDGPAWFFANVSSVNTVGFAPDIDFRTLQNMTPGGIPVGSSRNATELVYNVSKKTALTITNIQITGANPGDFVISPQTISSAASTVLPANKGAAEAIQITFAPTAEGMRTANVVFTSVAGVVQIVVTGAGLPTRPILSGLGPVSFFADSAPDTFIVQNTGGSTLVLNGISIGGADPAAFALRVANSGFSNCFAGVPLGPLSFCYIAVSEVDGAPVPSSGSLVILSNDPLNPEMDVPLSLVSPP